MTRGDPPEPQHQNRATVSARTAMPDIVVRERGVIEYQPCWQAMREFTQERTTSTADEIWLLEHPPVFTQGQAGKPEHLLRPGRIPVVQADRGGQVTYHGPGQIIAYTLLDLRRLKLGVRDMVILLEDCVIEVLRQCGVAAGGDREAPGVYVDSAKIAALGLRVSRGCCFHGVALNVNPDLEPFERINPCGFSGLRVTSLLQQGVGQDPLVVGRMLATEVVSRIRLL